jgi:hypothetical protein
MNDAKSAFFEFTSILESCFAWNSFESNRSIPSRPGYVSNFWVEGGPALRSLLIILRSKQTMCCAFHFVVIFRNI